MHNGAPMKIKFTCPACGDHVLICTTSYEVMSSKQITGMDGNQDPIYGEISDYAQSDEVAKYHCHICGHEVAGDLAISQMIEKGLKEGWLEQE